MIKGINKQVLEVLEPNNSYFEKALFFVKPEYSGYSENKLKDLAYHELKSVLNPPSQKTKYNFKKIKLIVSLFSTLLIGVILGFLLSYFIWYFCWNMIIYYHINIK